MFFTKTQGEGLRQCLLAVQQGYELCATADLECQCTFAKDVAERCYNGCPENEDISYVRAFVTDQCSLAKTIAAAGIRFEGDSDLQHRDDDLPFPFPEGGWPGNEEQDDDLEEDTQVPRFRGPVSEDKDQSINLPEEDESDCGDDERDEEPILNTKPTPRETVNTIDGDKAKYISDPTPALPDYEYDEEEEEEEEEDDDDEEDENSNRGSRLKKLWRKLIGKEQYDGEINDLEDFDDGRISRRNLHILEDLLDNSELDEPDFNIDDDSAESMTWDLLRKKKEFFKKGWKMFIPKKKYQETPDDEDDTSIVPAPFFNSTTKLTPTYTVVPPTLVPEPETPEIEKPDLQEPKPEKSKEEKPQSEEPQIEEPKEEGIEGPPCEPEENGGLTETQIETETDIATKTVLDTIVETETIFPTHEPAITSDKPIFRSTTTPTPSFVDTKESETTIIGPNEPYTTEEPEPETTEEPENDDHSSCYEDELEPTETYPISTTEPTSTEESAAEPSKKPEHTEKDDDNDEEEENEENESEQDDTSTFTLEPTEESEDVYHSTCYEEEPEPTYTPGSTTEEEQESTPVPVESEKPVITKSPKPIISEPESEDDTQETEESEEKIEEPQSSVAEPEKPVNTKSPKHWLSKPEPEEEPEEDTGEPEESDEDIEAPESEPEDTEHEQSKGDIDEPEPKEEPEEDSEEIEEPEPSAAEPENPLTTKSPESIIDAPELGEEPQERTEEPEELPESEEKINDAEPTISEPEEPKEPKEPKESEVAENPESTIGEPELIAPEPTISEPEEPKESEVAENPESTIGEPELIAPEPEEPSTIEEPEPNSEEVVSEEPEPTEPNDEDDYDSEPNPEPEPEQPSRNRSFKERFVDKLKKIFGKKKKAKSLYSLDADNDEADEDYTETETETYTPSKRDVSPGKPIGSAIPKISEHSDTNEDDLNDILEDDGSDEQVMAMFVSGANTVATCWVPLVAIFSCMAYYDLNPVFFFVLAGIATAYIHVFLPELSGSVNV